MTRPENLADHLNTLSPRDWKLLFDHLPRIKTTKKFGKLVGSKRLNDGTVALPYWKEDEIVSSVFNASYFLGIVLVFDWSAWDEGINILNNPGSDYAHYDITILCKLLTTIIRSDKFCEGYMIYCFEIGIAAKILSAMQTHIGQHAIHKHHMAVHK